MSLVSPIMGYQRCDTPMYFQMPMTLIFAFEFCLIYVYKMYDQKLHDIAVKVAINDSNFLQRLSYTIDIFYTIVDP